MIGAWFLKYHTYHTVGLDDNFPYSKFVSQKKENVSSIQLARGVGYQPAMDHMCAMCHSSADTTSASH